jgi:hypothetical protein
MALIIISLIIFCGKSFLPIDAEGKLSHAFCFWIGLPLTFAFYALSIASVLETVSVFNRLRPLFRLVGILPAFYMMLPLFFAWHSSSS